jgi:hypothetical protein
MSNYNIIFSDFRPSDQPILNTDPSYTLVPHLVWLDLIELLDADQRHALKLAINATQNGPYRIKLA